VLTDDGALLHRIISRAGKLAKRYRATLAAPLVGDEAALFASGEMLLEGRPSRCCRRS
jgi:16S rRNA pseudouridine516 synthase